MIDHLMSGEVPRRTMGNAAKDVREPKANVYCEECKNYTGIYSQEGKIVHRCNLRSVIIKNYGKNPIRRMEQLQYAVPWVNALEKNAINRCKDYAPLEEEY